MANLKTWENIGDDNVDRVSTTSVEEISNAQVTTTARTLSTQEQPSSPTYETVAEKRLLSQQSGLAPFHTLFNDLHLKATPVYNFYEPNEEETGFTRDKQELVDVPRYVKLTWEKAPQVKDPDEIKKRALSWGSPDARFFVKLSPFGFGATVTAGTTVQGMNFTPPLLQSNNFKENASNCANEFIFTGIVTAVASAASTSTGNSTTNDLDEDDYNENEENSGIPFSAANAQHLAQNSVVAGTQDAFGDQTTTDASNGLVDGKVGVTARNNSTEVIGGVGASVSTVEDEGTTATVNAIHTDFSGFLTQERLNNASAAQHIETLIALAQSSKELVTYSQSGYQHYSRELQIPSYTAPADLLPIEYIGYVIEKWSSENGAYSLHDTFYVPGREYTEFYDCDVKYGTSYRYRIKTILRWCRSKFVGVMGKDWSIIDTGQNTSLPNVVSHFHSEWAPEWAHAFVIDRSYPNPPDELYVQPFSRPNRDGKIRINVSFKFPHNPQKDINQMMLLRKTQNVLTGEETSWVVVSDEENPDGIIYGPENSSYDDFNVDYVQKNNLRYIYAAICITRHGEISKLSEQLSCTLNADWKKQGEHLVRLFSCAGVDMDYDFGQFSTWPVTRFREELISKGDYVRNKKAAIIVKAQDRFAQKALGNSTYVVRVESLDTGQIFDKQLNVVVTNLQEEQQVVKYESLVTLRSDSAA